LSKRLFLACFAVAALFAPGQVRAQFTDPRNYENTPVGLNQVELAYSYVHANASLDTSVIVAGARFNLNQGTIDYTRYFGFLHRMFWVEATLPLAGLSGSVSGTNLQGSVSGAGDSSYQLAALLKGGPALSFEQFKNYEPTTTLGVSFTMTAPTGLYNVNKILNLGTNRWSFKPEIAWSHPFGPEKKWEFDAYANAYFYTSNTSYHGANILRQEPLPGFEGHISYSLTDSVWASLDTRYSFGGSTLINGLNQNDTQQNFIIGSELNVSLNLHSSLTFEFAKVLAHQNGAAYTGFAVKYDYNWGKGFR